MSPFWVAAASWLLHFTVGGGLLLLVAAVLMRRLPHPAARQRLGEVGLIAALLLAVLSLAPAWLPLPVSLAGPRPASLSQAPDAEQVSVTPTADEGDESDLKAPPAKGAKALETPGDLAPVIEKNEAGPTEAVVPLETLAAAFVGVYLLGAGVVLCRWLLGCLALGRLLRAAGPAPESVADLFAAMVGPVRRRPRLLVSPYLRVPLSCGLFRPTVVVPAALCHPPDLATLRWVFAHELTHLGRRDAWSCWLFGLGQAVCFYLPWYWQIRRQVRLCQELIADAAVTEQGAAAADYAEFLVKLTRRPALPVGATGVLGSSSDLFRRIAMLLQDPVRGNSRCPGRWPVAACTSFLVLGVLGAGVGIRATPALADDSAPAGKAAPADSKEKKLADRKDDKKQVDVEVILTTELKKALEELQKIKPDLQPRLTKELGNALEKLGQADLPKIRIDVKRPVLEKLKVLLVEVPNLPLAGADDDAIRKEIAKLMEQIKAHQAKIQALTKMQVEERLRAARARLGSGGRLGVKLGRPGDALADQLDLPRGRGLVVEEVSAGSPAAKAGIKVNDVLLELNGKTVASDVAALQKMLDEIKPSTPVDVLVLRKGKKETIKGLTLTDARSKIRRGWKLVLPGGPDEPLVGPILVSALGGDGVVTTVVKRDGKVTAHYREGKLSITLNGTEADGKTRVEKITGRDGETSFSLGKGDTLDKVPEKYRDKVKKLIEMSGAKE
jgi:beta-lactamase regulating signal transducer with metallopeptidase domain